MGTISGCDEFGNVVTVYTIDETEIWNVPDSIRFMRVGELTETEREVLDALRNALPHTRNGEDLSRGNLFAVGRNPPSHSGIPLEVLLGRIVDSDGRKYVEGNILITYHANEDPNVKPDLVGFELDRKSERRDLCFNDALILGTPLTPERYSTLVDTLRGFSKERSIAHPTTKEFNRQSEEYRMVVSQYKKVGLQEVMGGMFKVGGTQKSDGWVLVAVHPFYMKYHDSNGQRRKLSTKERSALMKSYDDLFGGHQGALVVVEEQDKIPETLERLRKNGRIAETYFVPTKNRLSSLFPFTEDGDFMDLLYGLGVEGLKFFVGHDSF